MIRTYGVRNFFKTQKACDFLTWIRNLIKFCIRIIGLIIFFYFIPSSEINAYQKQIKVISITSEMI